MKLSLVVPVYNEEAAISLFYSAVRENEALSGYQVEIVFINDGSSDATRKIAAGLANKDADVVLVDFSRNFGKEPALFAGLSYASGEAVIPIDVDLQDPIEAIPEMIACWQSGAEVVLAKRADRSSDGYFKRRTAELFYQLHNWISEPKIEPNVGDFRLMSRNVVDAILTLPERKLFMKGVLSWVGFKTEVIEYSRAERIAGKTKFNGWKLWNLAVEGITSFSTVPLRIWTYLGFGVATFAFVYAAILILDKLLLGNPVPGYPSLMTTVLFLGGVQLIGIGVLGEYIGRIYTESKQRPRYIVREIVQQSSSPATQQDKNPQYPGGREL